MDRTIELSKAAVRAKNAIAQLEAEHKVLRELCTRMDEAAKVANEAACKKWREVVAMKNHEADILREVLAAEKAGEL